MDSWSWWKSWYANRNKHSSRQIRCLYTKILRSCGTFKETMNSQIWKNNILFLERSYLFNSKNNNIWVQMHRVKSVQIWSYFWSVFSCIRTECGEIRSSFEIRKLVLRDAAQLKAGGLCKKSKLISMGISSKSKNSRKCSERIIKKWKEKVTVNIQDNRYFLRCMVIDSIFLIMTNRYYFYLKDSNLKSCYFSMYSKIS